MRKKILLFLFSPAIYYSQVGINTSNPQATFHVDGAKDNAPTGTPTIVQQSNDFVVSNLGRVGIGITNPAARLHLYNHIAGSDVNDDYLFDDESPISNSHSILLRRSNASTNLLNGNIIGSVLFNARVNGNFSSTGAGIQGIHRGNGTIQNNALAFLINSSSEAGRFDEFGNLGVGITVPKEKLDVQGAISFAGQAALNKTAQGTIDYPNPGSVGNQLRLLSWGGDAVTNGVISFWTGFANTNPVERMRIHSNGNVGIGTAAPVAKLDVAGNVKIADGTQGIGKILVSDANGLASWQNASTASNNIYNSNGTLTTDRTVTQAAHSITFTGGNFNVIPASSGTGLSVIGSSNKPVTSSPRIFSQEGLELQSNSNQGVVILNGLWPLVATNPVFRVVYGNGNNTPSQIEYLRIQGNGNVGIGTAAPAAKLDVAGNVKIADGTQGLGKILVSDANGLASWQNASTASKNIYNSDGSLTSDRNVDLNGHNLAFTGTGNVGIGIANPNPNASLDLGATNQAFITNRVANTAAIANPVNGMIIYVNDNKCFKGYANGSWQNLGKCQGQPVLSDNLSETRIIHINPDTTSPYYGAFVFYHYTGGTGATIPVISVASTSAGITGLTLETTQNADDGSGEGNLVFHIKGTPSSHGGYAYFPPFTIFGIVFDLHYYVL